jgi:hypothetical protein
VKTCLSRRVLTKELVRKNSRRAREYMCVYHVFHHQQQETQASVTIYIPQYGYSTRFLSSKSALKRARQHVHFHSAEVRHGMSSAPFLVCPACYFNMDYSMDQQ